MLVSMIFDAKCCGRRQLSQSRTCGASQHAADAVAAKAEGVAQRPQRFPALRTPCGQTYDAMRRMCSLRGALPLWGRRSEHRERSGAFPRQTSFPDHMDISIPGSLLAAVSAACCPPQR